VDTACKSRAEKRTFCAARRSWKGSVATLMSQVEIALPHLSLPSVTQELKKATLCA